MFKLFIISSFLGSISILLQAPWNLFYLIFLIFPGLYLALDYGIKFKSFIKNFLSTIIILGGFFYFYFLFGFSWIVSAFDYRSEMEIFKYLTLFGLPFLMLIFIIPSFIILTIFWDKKINKVLSLALCISIGEFIRGNIFTGFSWNNFSHAFVVNDSLMQIFSVTGQYLATFLLVLTAQFIIFLWKKNDIFFAFTLFLILPSIFLYGLIRIKDNQFDTDNIVGVVQPNISQSEKLEGNNENKIIFDLIELSSKEYADLLIWPESTVPVLLQYNSDIIESIFEELPDKTELLIGNITYSGNKFQNSALLLDQTNKIKDVYHKIHLVPFGEYIPLKELLSNFAFLKTVTGEIGFEKGLEVNSISTNIGTARVVICYEIIFPEEINPKKDKLDFLINITNDAWFGKSSGPYQHFTATRFRAVEQGLPAFRSANTGISGIIDPYGRVINKINLDVSGAIFSPLPKKIKETYYSKVGDLLFFGIIIITLLIMFFIKKKKKYE